MFDIAIQVCRKLLQLTRAIKQIQHHIYGIAGHGKGEVDHVEGIAKVSMLGKW